MKKRHVVQLVFLVLIAIGLMFLYGCPPPKAEHVKAVKIPDGEIDPAAWGKAYPTNYELWKKTEEPTAAGKSKYKRGFDADRVTYDKLSEFPYMALLFNGWGFGIEYNEPRGHAYMMKDQLDIDPARVGAGGVCLTCKSPYAPILEKEKGFDYYSKPWSVGGVAVVASRVRGRGRGGRRRRSTLRRPVARGGDALARRSRGVRRLSGPGAQWTRTAVSHHVAELTPANPNNESTF